MYPPPAALWSINVVLDTIGHVAFKFAAKRGADDVPGDWWWRMFQRPSLWLGVVCFAIEFIVWLAFLSLVPLSQGVLLGSFNIVVLMLVGRWIFAERLTHWRIAGIGFIALGVGLVGAG